MTKEDFYKRLIEEKGLELIDTSSNKKSQASPKETPRDLTRKILSREMKFENIQMSREFYRFDFPGVKKPFRLRKNGLKKIHYAKFLEAGTESRRKVTNIIMKILKEELGEDLRLHTLGDKDGSLNYRLFEFENIPFKNAPSVIPNEKIELSFNVTHLDSFHKIGAISYIFPHTYTATSSDSSEYTSLDLGGINLNVLGSAIQTDVQYKNLTEKLSIILHF